MSAAPRRQADLLEGIDAPASARDIFINGLTLDSRRVQRGNAFIALRGSTAHGITFAPAALALGASVSHRRSTGARRFGKCGGRRPLSFPFPACGGRCRRRKGRSGI